MKLACFGVPAAVSAASATCRGCPDRGSCVANAEQRVSELPDSPLTQRERLALSVTRIGLVGTPARAGQTNPQPTVLASPTGVCKVEPSPEQAQMLTTLPARVSSQALSLIRKGWFDFARQEMAAGRNPGKPGWQKVLCALLIAPGGTDRAAIQMAFVQELGMTPGSAKTQVSFGISTFAVGGIVRELSGKIAFSPN